MATIGAGPDVTPQLRPLSIGELLDAAIKVCTANAGTLLRAVIVVVVPVQILAAIIQISTIDAASFDSGRITTGDAAYIAGQLLVNLLFLVMFLLATGACFRAIAEAWLGHRPDWRDSLRFAARHSLSLLWISILYFLAVLVGLFGVIIGAIFLGVAFSVSFPVHFVEDRRGTKALGRSWTLVKGRWWATFAVLFLAALLAVVVQFVMGFIFGLLTVFNDSFAFFIVISTLATAAALLITTPFQAAIVALVYFDLRVRKEGFDLQVLAERLGGGAGAPAAAGAGSLDTSSSPLAERPSAAWPSAPSGPSSPFGAPAESTEDPRSEPPSSGWLPPGQDPPR
jgi:hypothetical protein